MSLAQGPQRSNAGDFVILNFYPCTHVNILTGQQTYPLVTHNNSQNENPQKKQEQMG